MVERRRARRFELKFPVELLRTGPLPASRVGETRNVSSAGALIATEARIPAGEPVEYLITLPVSGEGDRPVQLRCMGKVVRSYDKASAVTLERYEFLRS